MPASPEVIAIISGPVSVGKTTLSTTLEQNLGFQRLSTKDLIQTRAPEAAGSRRLLQEAGEHLDEETDGTWIADALVRYLQQAGSPKRVVIDAVRIEEQVRAVRKAYGRKVTHVHLTAPCDVLSRRYEQDRRESELDELPDYSTVRDNPTERNIESLKAVADAVIDTARTRPLDVVVRTASHLGFFDSSHRRVVDVLVGAQYGSEGKGQVAAYLAPEYDVLIRVGGPNAGHSVWAQPEPYRFHHLPSGTMDADADLVIGPGAVLRPESLLDEIVEFKVSVDRLSIDPQAMVIEEEDILEEHGLVESIGSTGQGVGAATARKILRTEANPAVRLAKDVERLSPFVRKTARLLDEMFAAGKRVMLEGTQGTHLSVHHGSYPHVTSRDTTVAGCLAEAGINPRRLNRSILVCRTYPIRVEGPSGPMSREIDWSTVAERSGIPLEELREVETTSTTGRQRRVGEFDWSLLQRASAINGSTDIALTFTDYFSIRNREARRFDQLTEDTILFVDEIERVAGAPVSLISTRFHRRSIIDRRSW